METHFTRTEEHGLTVLRSSGPRMAKTWTDEGKIDAYQRAKQFTVERRPFESIDELHRHLEALQADSRACVIRGVPAAPIPAGATVQRLIGNFVDGPSTLCMLDIDHYAPDGIDPLREPEAAIEQCIERTLPGCFRGKSYVYQLSGSMGHPTKPGSLRAHLWFVLHAPMTCAQLEAWAKEHLPQCDPTVHRVVQVNYTAAPVIAPGSPPDPLAGRRLGLVRGYLDDVVRIPPTMPVPDNVPQLRQDRRQMLDPRNKPGIIGAVCRAWRPHQIVELFPDHFATGTTPERITWLHGGGAAEGVCVTDDGLHLYNSHASAPLQTGHLFDFIRAHVFGHLDPKGALAAPAATSAPSYRATTKWAGDQPEVRAELEEVAASSPPVRGQQAEAGSTLAKAARQMVGIDAIQDSINHATLNELETRIGPEIASGRYSDGERALLARAIQAKTREFVPPAGIGIETVRRWIIPRTGCSPVVFPDVTSKGGPKVTLDNVLAVLNAMGCTVRYNLISKETELIGDGLAFNTDNCLDAQLTTLTSECARAGMPYKRDAIAAMVVVLGDRNPYNPVLEWIESVPWDGKDRLLALSATVEADPQFDAAVKCMLMRRWLLQCVAVAASPVPIQARGVLTFCGTQYIGKTKWLQSLVGERLNLVITGRMIDPHSKDSVRTAIGAWLCELGEADATLRRSDIAALKAFVSQDTDQMRLPYAARDSKFQRRTSFFASVNHPNFLSDSTGNTRFWTIPVVRVQHDHQIDMQQLWAQVLKLYRDGEQYWLSPEEMALLQEVSADHQAEDPLLEAIETTFAFDQVRADGMAAPGVVWKGMTATEVAKAIGWSKPTPGEAARVGLHLRNLGVTRLPRKPRLKRWNMPTRPGQFEDFDGPNGSF